MSIVAPVINQGSIDSSTLASTLASGSALSQAQSDIFYKNLQNVLPGYKDILSSGADAVKKTSALAKQMMSGTLPDDVVAAITRSRAATGMSRGLFGGAAQAGTARDLGLNSLQMTQAGAQMEANVVSPLTQSLLKNALSLTPTPLDFSSLYNATAQRQTQVAETNAAMQWEATMSEFTAGREDQNIARSQQNSKNMMDELNRMINANQQQVPTLPSLSLPGTSVPSSTSSGSSSPYLNGNSDIYQTIDGSYVNANSAEAGLDIMGGVMNDPFYGLDDASSDPYSGYDWSSDGGN